MHVMVVKCITFTANRRNAEKTILNFRNKFTKNDRNASLTLMAFNYKIVYLNLLKR